LALRDGEKRLSAICGIYYFDDRPVKAGTGADLMRALGIYHADATGTWREGPVFFGCHTWHLTPESVGESLPYYDKAAGLAITADAILDNRTILCHELGIDYGQWGTMPDSLLILQAFRKWGQDCVKYLLGDFAFAIWDEKRRELFCAVDQTGTRAFYYYHSAGLFAFSTLIKPLFVLPEIAKEHSKTWFADFLAIPTVMHQLDPELTLYKNIYLLPAGHTLAVRPGRVVKRVYWQVKRQPELQLKSDGDYEEAFREVFGEAIRCRLRSIRPVGVMMSGGLDSTSVACMAARELSGSGRRLQAFSAVPMRGYRDWLPAGRLADETPYIEAVREYSGNIDVTYCRAEGKHCLSETDRLLRILEQPYKIFANLFWIDDILATARECNRGVVLCGSAGNVTISWGDVSPYLLSLFRSGQWSRLLHESWGIARNSRRPFRKLWELSGVLLPENIRKGVKKLKDRNWSKSLRDLTAINPHFARRFSVRERFRRFGYDPLFIKRLDSFEARENCLRPDFFSHLGVLTTKLSLAHGVALRDPTMDKRVIEFCLRVPDNQYVRNGRGRFLLRRAMAGILPDKVRENGKERGQQSADLAQRLQSCWPQWAAEIKTIGLRADEREYLDVNKIQERLAQIGALSDDASEDSHLRMLIRSLVFSRFLKQEDIAAGAGSTEI